MARKLFIVTGSSRGMGAAIAEQLLAASDCTVLGIARRANETLPAKARATGATCEQWTMDLAEPLPVAERLEAWLGRARRGQLRRGHPDQQRGPR